MTSHKNIEIGINRKTESAFSLIETLVSLTILTISLLVLFQIFSGGLYNIEHREQNYKAALFAKSLAARLGRELPLETGLQKGESEQGYEWIIEITPYDTYHEVVLPQSTQGQLYAIYIHLKWQSGIRQKNLEFSLLRYGEEQAL